MPAARPRVGLVSQSADFYGGGQRSLLDLAVALRDGRHEPVVVLPGAGPLATELERAGVEWIAAPLPAVRGRSGRRAVRALRRLIGTVRSARLDLLHSDSPRTALYAGLATRLTGARHVWHLRASRPSSALSDRMLAGLCDAILAVSGAAARRSRALRASRKVRVVHTGLPPIDFLAPAAARAALGLPADGFIAGVIGRVERDKGGEDAVAALPGIRRAVPGARLAFVGPVDRQAAFPHRLSLRAAAAGLKGDVLFTGEHPVAARCLRAFDIILHPSRHEALPRVLIEALYAGVPAVAASVGGVGEVIDEGIGGLLVPPGDPRALGEAAVRLALDPALRAAVTAAGARRAPARFGLEGMRRDITAVYDSLLRDRPALARAAEGESG